VIFSEPPSGDKDEKACNSFLRNSSLLFLLSPFEVDRDLPLKLLSVDFLTPGLVIPFMVLLSLGLCRPHVPLFFLWTPNLLDPFLGLQTPH